MWKGGLRGLGKANQRLENAASVIGTAGVLVSSLWGGLGKEIDFVRSHRSALSFLTSCSSSSEEECFLRYGSEAMPPRLLRVLATPHRFQELSHHLHIPEAEVRGTW